MALIPHPAFPPPLPLAPARWDDVPLDVLHLVAAALPSAKDLCAFEGVCRATRAAASDDGLWRALCARAFPGAVAPGGGARPGRDLTWRELYRFNHVFLYKCLVGKRPDAAPRLVTLGRGAFFVALPPRVAA